MTVVSDALRLQVTGKVLVIGTGDCGQLGLGEDVAEKLRPGALELPSGRQVWSSVSSEYGTYSHALVQLCAVTRQSGDGDAFANSCVCAGFATVQIPRFVQALMYNHAMLVDLAS